MKLDYSVLGKKIKELRHERKISQEELINILDTEYNCGLSRNTLSAIENYSLRKHNKRLRIDLYAVTSIADLFSVDVGYLIGEQGITYMQKETGLNPRSIAYLRKSKGKVILDTINLLLQKAHTSNQEHLIELISAYLNADEEELKESSFRLNGEDGHDIRITVGVAAILNVIMTTLAEYRKAIWSHKK